MGINSVTPTVSGLSMNSRSITGEASGKKYSYHVTAVANADSTSKTTSYTVDYVMNFTPNAIVVVSGCTNSANNGTFQIISIDEDNNKLTLNNASGTAETAPSVAVVYYSDDTVGKHVIVSGLSTLSELIANATNQTGAPTTYYYPTSAGIDMRAFKDISFECEISANETLTFEGSNDTAFTTAKDITKAGYELLTNTLGNASFAGAQNIIIDFDNFNMDKIRAKLVCSSGTNSIKIWARRKA